MSFTTYLTKPEFYTYTELTAGDEVTDATITQLITDFNLLLVEKLTDLFTIQAFTNKYYPTNADNFILVGAWQASSLVVKKGTDGNATLTTLTLDTDYNLIHWKPKTPSKTHHVIAIRLKSCALSRNQYLQLEGNYGVASAVPAEIQLKHKMYDLIKRAALVIKQEQESGGYGELTSTSMGKVSVTFGSPINYQATVRLNVQQAIFNVNQLLDGIVRKYNIPSYYFGSVIG